MGYAKWDNFLNVVSKAKTACEVSGHEIIDHFADVGKMVDLDSDSQREVGEVATPAISTRNAFPGPPTVLQPSRHFWSLQANYDPDRMLM